VHVAYTCSIEHGLFQLLPVFRVDPGTRSSPGNLAVDSHDISHVFTGVRNFMLVVAAKYGSIAVNAWLPLASVMPIIPTLGL
jgi:hypothetical protein